MPTTTTAMKQNLNPATGRFDAFDLHPDSYDNTQEIARSAFADMLHDTERNQKYEVGLRTAIQRMHAAGREAHVLDIGTGTGILAMMAVRCGADSVHACEAFRPMADCAARIMTANGKRAQITLIKKRSTDVVVGGADGDMARRANILVTEVFDTELIGEGAIGIFNHAHEHLLEKECIVVPDRAIMYAQVVQSPLCQAWSVPRPVVASDGRCLLSTPEKIANCCGSAALHDVQLSQLSITEFETVLPPQPVLTFDFSGRHPIPTESNVSLPTIASADGQTNAVFMWWDIDMDQKHEIRLSCAPWWAHPDYHSKPTKELPTPDSRDADPPQNAIPWRDHWMQAIYPVTQGVHVRRNETVHLNFSHDEFSLWFDVSRERKVFGADNRLPMCECGFHSAFSRTRIGQMSDERRMRKYVGVLESSIDAQSVVLGLGDGNVLALACSRLGAKSVTCLETQRYAKEAMELYVRENELHNVRLVASEEELGAALSMVTHVVAEPSFVSSIVPFDNLCFGTLLLRLRERHGLRKDVVLLMPRRAVTWAMPVEFLDLHKIRAPMAVREGFDMSIFDGLVDSATRQADATVEAQPLWEYPCRALAKAKVVLEVDFDEFAEDKRVETLFDFGVSGVCNGVTIWTDWALADGTFESSGPKCPADTIQPGKLIDWDMHSRQGVHLFANEQIVTSETTMVCMSSFAPKDSSIDFRFEFC